MYGLQANNLPPQMKILNAIIPIQMHFFTFSPAKLQYFAQ